MNMESLTVKMPAFLASALINGDTSGLECSCGALYDRESEGLALHTGDCDFRWYQAALDYCAPGHVVSTACTCGEAEKAPKDRGYCAPGCGDPYFSWSCPLPGWHLGANMLDYVVYPEEG